MAKAYKLNSLLKSSHKIQFLWALAVLSDLLDVPKKTLRRACKILCQERLEAEILENGKLVVRIFHFGFRSFIKKEEHKERKILAPHPDVQEAYRAINEWLHRLSCHHPNAYGFVKERCPKKAVELLLESHHFFGRRHFLSFDIANAFPSINSEMVRKALEDKELHSVLAESLAWFATHHYENARRLPQGAASSPALLNLVYKPMCEEIDRVCKKNGLTWAVYADDFSFTSDYISPETREALLSIPQKFSFEVKKKKTKDNNGKTIPRILGLTVVNNAIHIKHKKKNEYRRILYAAAKFEAYPKAKILGIRHYISHIYGEEKNWPGWILKPWKEYQAMLKIKEGIYAETNTRVG